MSRATALDKLVSKWAKHDVIGVEETLDKKGLVGLAELLQANGVESKELKTKAEGDTPPPTDEPTPDDEDEGIARLMKDMIEGMGSLEKRFGEYKAMVEAQGAKQLSAEKEYKTTLETQNGVIADLSKRLKAAEERLNTQPRSAIGNQASADIGDKLKDNLPEYTGDEVQFGSFKMKKEALNNGKNGDGK